MSILKEKMIKLREASEKAAAEHLLLNNTKVTPEQQEARYSICESCDRLHAATNRCNLCGCFMGVKTWLKSQECPLKKWEKEIDIVEK